MATWVIQRAEQHADATEANVAHHLEKLPAGWVICWGFYYLDNSSISREGDFLILSPEGDAMVLEVKGGPLRIHASTGMVEGELTGDHPYIQLQMEWGGLLKRIESAQRRINAPFGVYLRKCLAFPNESSIPTGEEFYQGIPRREILDRNQIENFQATWRALQTKGQPLPAQRDYGRRVFMQEFARAAILENARNFLDETDRLIERYTQLEFEILDQLQGNRQFLISGGAGTGKTFLALEQACRWATAEGENEGRLVLLLCYNLPLEQHLNAFIKKHPPKFGSVTVMCFENLAKMLFRTAGIPWEPPLEGRADLEKFYSQTVPEIMWQAVNADGFQRSYDALVVDEAQDHDTDGSQTSGGWWPIYFKLLIEGGDSRIAVYHDAAQRPSWRAGSFSEDTIANLLMNPVRVQLTKPVRYTRTIAEYLLSLDSPETNSLLHPSKALHQLPVGPAVSFHEAKSDLDLRNVVAKILKEWLESGQCQPGEVLILHPGWKEASRWLVQTQTSFYDGYPAPKGKTSYLSVHRAKGLEARGIIVLADETFENLGTIPHRCHSYFMACSRARQCLAIVHVNAYNPRG